MQPPATADALNDTEPLAVRKSPPVKVANAVDLDDENGASQKEGLQHAFFPGEKLPWKGIWFKVEMVGRDAILLKPQTETAGHRKNRTGRG